MASFIDRAIIKVKAGDGGDGKVSFHREKFVQNGGPDGGDGGHGGDVIFVADPNMHTLMDFRFHTKFHAKNGQPGGARRFSGKSGEALRIRVPVGTVVKDRKTEAVLADMSQPGREKVLLHGGRGGWGNDRFKTPVRQAPNFAKPGMKTEEREFILELKTLADVGLVGYPNVGKSSILSVVTNARPKIANYHFTTLTPNLGIVRAKGGDFVIADIPGLIENAAEGAGLGFYFLRHVERTRLLLHVVDISGVEGRDPLDDLRIINNELKRYGDLDQRPSMIVANKMDLPGAEENLARLRETFPDKKVFAVSAATGQGFETLIEEVARQLKNLPPVVVFEETEVDETPQIQGWEIKEIKDAYEIHGPSIENLMASVNFEDFESLNWFHRTLRRTGIIDALKEAGCQEGDTVRIGETEFEFVE
ncbi:MAG: GTPase ObgE [Christensenellales bacterium]|jgi:GTP-binding protein